VRAGRNSLRPARIRLGPRLLHDPGGGGLSGEHQRAWNSAPPDEHQADCWGGATPPGMQRIQLDFGTRQPQRTGRRGREQGEVPGLALAVVFVPIPRESLRPPVDGGPRGAVTRV